MHDRGADREHDRKRHHDEHELPLPRPLRARGRRALEHARAQALRRDGGIRPQLGDERLVPVHFASVSCGHRTSPLSSRFKARLSRVEQAVVADSEHARRARAVELEQHAQRHDLALRRRQPMQSLLELRRQAVGEDGLLEQRLVADVALLAPLAPGLGPEPVDGGGVRDAAEPRARRAAARVEAAPAAERPLEGLRREILRRRPVAGEVDEVAVDGVEVLRDDVREGRCRHPGGRADSCRQRVHSLHTAPGGRTVTSER